MMIFWLTCLVGYPQTSAPEPFLYQVGTKITSSKNVNTCYRCFFTKYFLLLGDFPGEMNLIQDFCCNFAAVLERATNRLSNFSTKLVEN